jgi:hypothetical protein
VYTGILQEFPNNDYTTIFQISSPQNSPGCKELTRSNDVPSSFLPPSPAPAHLQVTSGPPLPKPLGISKSNLEINQQETNKNHSILHKPSK